MKSSKDIKIIRRLTILFMVCLALSGITAFPLQTEMAFLNEHKSIFPQAFQNWITQVYLSVTSTKQEILYGMDWLAFGHLVIATFFIGVIIDPVKNKFIVGVGIFACFAIFPVAFICGPVRGIPFFHQLIDCSFGVIALIPLTIIYRKIQKIENTNEKQHI